MKVESVILEGGFVRLEPMQIDHVPTLSKVGLEESLWEWGIRTLKNEGDIAEYVHTAIEEKNKGISLPFVTTEKLNGTVVGSTRFGNIDVVNRKAEIGWTWINPKWQRTVVNSEAKLLMLTHAFEVWKCIRVEFKTDVLNEKSKNAIRRIGGTEEGIFRNHVITESGRIRDSIYFSIIETEWEKVKANLRSMVSVKS